MNRYQLAAVCCSVMDREPMIDKYKNYCQALR